MFVVAVTYSILEISARETSALAVQYTFKTYILINIQDIYLILLTKIGKKNALSLYLTIIPRGRVGYEMIDSQRGA